MPEVTRRLEEIAKRLEALTTTLEQGYVRKDVYEADERTNDVWRAGIEDEHRTMGQRLDGLHSRFDAFKAQQDKDRQTAANRSGDRRFTTTMIVITAFVGPILTTVMLHLLGFLGAK